MVEDDEQIRELVAHVFELAGCDVRVAENGAQALDRVREACPHLIVLDLMMPVLNGWEFLEVTAREGLCASTAIVVIQALLAAVKTDPDPTPSGSANTAGRRRMTNSEGLGTAQRGHREGPEREPWWQTRLSRTAVVAREPAYP